MPTSTAAARAKGEHDDGGFSSPGRLVGLPLDGLEIDRRFVVALLHGEAARSIVGGPVRIAHHGAAVG